MIKNILILFAILLNTGCSTKVLKPAMELTLIDKVSKQTIKEAINTKNIALDKDSKLIMKKIMSEEFSSVFDVVHVFSIISIAPKGYNPQWCFCHISNKNDAQCEPRVVEFTPQKTPKDITQNELKELSKKGNEFITFFEKDLKKRLDTSNIPVFYVDDIQIRKR